MNQPMSMYQTILRPALFQLDPEAAHERAVGMISRGLVRVKRFEHPLLRQTFFGTQFQNPLGLAAGFDKNATGINHWHKLGFGFVEVGTITSEGQPGNPKPRLFRLTNDEALINRLGFNNEGAEEISKRIAGSNPKVPLGINIGKSRECPVEEAAKDYASSFRMLHRFGTYFAINVSSPNTPGLRGLQAPGELAELIGAMREVDDKRPLLVKIAPDLEKVDLEAIIRLAHDMNLEGLIATNTTIRRPGLQTHIEEEGGLSGRPLRGLATRFMRDLYVSCDKTKVLIGVGGIMNGDDLFDRIASGAHLCQMYTGWVYGGPKTAVTSLERLVGLMKERGFKSLAELRGSAVVK